jgi:hypothetical protein
MLIHPLFCFPKADNTTCTVPCTTRIQFMPLQLFPSRIAPLGDSGGDLTLVPLPPQLLLAMPPPELTASTTQRVNKDGGGMTFVHLSCGGGPGQSGELSRRGELGDSAAEAVHCGRILCGRSSLSNQAGRCTWYVRPPTPYRWVPISVA